ncbi:MAG: hypothetical protein HKN83_01520 [Gammaproteobacteria bacterium]|nr:hypothetical protein [Gammaproteobacteria bacterium]
MIKTYSQRLLPPYYGLAQIAESERARAVTADGQTWEIQFLHQGNNGLTQSSNGSKQSNLRYRRAVTISNSEIQQKNIGLDEEQIVDERILELTEFLADITLPFPAADHFEYWLLDAKDQSPLALIFSAKDPEQMNAYPSRPEWTALPAAVMPIEMTEDEQSYSSAPVNYRLERLVAERAGINPKAKWFTRSLNEEQLFPTLMLTEDWLEEESVDLCQRYLKRQASRLLMLHSLNQEQRRQLEINARSNAIEVARFYQLYPEVVDQVLMNAILVEAKLRSVSEDQPELHKRRDGIHYL